MNNTPRLGWNRLGWKFALFRFPGLSFTQQVVKTDSNDGHDHDNENFRLRGVRADGNRLTIPMDVTVYLMVRQNTSTTLTAGVYVVVRYVYK